MAADPHLVEMMRKALSGRDGISETKMFGGYCWMLNGNMLTGVAKERFMFRVGKDRQEEALARPGTSPMDFTGRQMRGLVWVDAESAIEAGVGNWIDYAEVFVGALPPK